MHFFKVIFLGIHVIWFLFVCSIDRFIWFNYFATISIQLSSSEQVGFQAQIADILVTVQQEVNPELRRKLCGVVAEVARNFNGGDLWTAVLKFFKQCADSPNVHLQEAALHIFTVPGIFNNSGLQNRIEKMLQDLFEKMAEIDDDLATFDEGNSDKNCMAVSAVDRLACGLGRKIVLPEISKFILKNLDIHRKKIS